MNTSSQDEFFGPLTWEPLCAYWEGSVTSADGSILRVYVSTPDGARDQSVTPAAHAALSRVLDAQAAFTQKAAADLLAIHNKAWHHTEGGPPLSSVEFERRLTLQGVHVFASGAAEAYYDDGDLFWGHVVSVPQEPDGTFRFEAYFEG